MLQKWAAVRELFTCRLEAFASHSTSSASHSTRVYSFDLSGQFIALDPILGKTGEAVQLTLADAKGNTLLIDTVSFPNKQLAAEEESKTSTVQGTTLTASFYSTTSSSSAKDTTASTASSSNAVSSSTSSISTTQSFRLLESSVAARQDNADSSQSDIQTSMAPSS